MRQKNVKIIISLTSLIFGFFLFNSCGQGIKTQFSASTTSITPPTTTGLFGQDKVLVLLVTFQDTPADFYKFPKATAADYIFNPNAVGLNKFLIENSYGKYSITGDVSDWILLPFNRPTGVSTTEFYKTANGAIAVAEKNMGIDRKDYKRFLFLGDIKTTYAYGAYAQIRTFKEPDPIPSSLIHEFGHTIGLTHANRWDCGPGISISLSGCTQKEYEDFFDIMGGRSGHFKAKTKIDFGWIAEEEIKTITKSGLYILEPYESKKAVTKLLRVPRGEGAWLEDLYIEYRQPIGYDKQIESIKNNLGVFQPSNAYMGPIIRLKSGLIDVTPNDGDWIKTGLYDGSTFVDPGTGTTIKVVSNIQDKVNPENSKLTLDINVGKTDLKAPTVEFISPVPGSIISSDLKIKFKVSDVSGVASVAASFVSGDVSDLIKSLGGGEYEVNIPMDAYTPGEYYFYVSTKDKSCAGIKDCQFDNEGHSSLLINFVGLPGKDYIPPEISIIAPSMGQEVSGLMAVNLNVTDNVGTSHAELYINGTLKSTSNKAPFNFLYDTKIELNGAMSIMVKAYDAAGNSGMAMTHVNILN